MPKKVYKALVGLDFPKGVRVEAGEQVPSTTPVAAWLVEQGFVEEVD